MTSLLESALANVVASFASSPAAPKPAPDALGVDLDCADDLDPMMGLASGLRTIAQAVYRRLSTPRGMIIDAPDYGFDLRSLLHKGMTPAEQASIPGRVRAEVLKDERIERAEVQLASATPDALSLVIRCHTAAGPFRLTLDVTAAAVVLTEVR